MILRLPDGYETQIGDNGKMLSAGQRQRIALAVALYRDPFLVVLDEPNSNLDAAGESALAQAIESVRARRGIVVVIAHRPSVLAGVDFVLVLNQGRVRNFGAKQEMLEAAISNFPLAANEGKASK
jgi:ABC-type protease/lipase transport system fused ATPase/permease subunit